MKFIMKHLNLTTLIDDLESKTHHVCSVIILLCKFLRFPKNARQKIKKMKYFFLFLLVRAKQDRTTRWREEIREKYENRNEGFANVIEGIKPGGSSPVSSPLTAEAQAALGPAAFYDCQNTVHYWPREGGLTMGCHVTRWQPGVAVSKSTKTLSSWIEEIKENSKKARVPNFQAYQLLLEDPDRRLDPVIVDVIDIKENRVYFNTPLVNKNWSRGELHFELDGLGVLITDEIVFHDFDDNKFWPLVLEGSKDEKKGDPTQFSLVKDLEGKF